ncbi:MAG: signal peptidase II [Pseudomonadota bacterium]
MNRTLPLFASTAFFILIFDQVTKYWIVWHLNLAERLRIDVFPPFLTFRMAWNEGINFGLPLGGPTVLISLAVAISIGLTWWVLRKGGAVLALGGGLVVGGAIGNALDRALYGAVADFLNMSCCGIDNPYAFNVADIAIFVGAVVIAFRA